MQIVSTGDASCFLKKMIMKKSKRSINGLSAELAQRVVKVNIDRRVYSVAFNIN